MKTAERIHKWDNLKTILMFLVVIGHFANQFTDNKIMNMVSLFIYSFHMPLFIFVSGLFCRSWLQKKGFSWDKPLYYILIGYALKIAIYLVKISFGKEPTFYMFQDTGIPWFMFAMAAFLVITYLIRKWDYRICLPVSILISCLAGYTDLIGNFLYLSRIIVFFPFYYVGYLLNPKEVLKVVNHRSMKAAAVGIIASAMIVCIAYIDDLYSYIRLFTARNAYANINVEGCGGIHRLVFYLVAFLMGLAVISLTPDREFKLADQIGPKTLQIYFWHRLVLYVLMYSGFAKMLSACFPSVWEFIYLGIAVLLTILLIPNVFNLPLQLLKTGERKVEQWTMALV